MLCMRRVQGRRAYAFLLALSVYVETKCKRSRRTLKLNDDETNRPEPVPTRNVTVATSAFSLIFAEK